MNVNELTIGEAREIAGMFGAGAGAGVAKAYPVEAGKCYFFRGVTYHWTGRVVRLVGSYAVLESAAWIASSGRFGESIARGIVDEAEYVGDATVNLDACVDIVPWKHALITETK